MSMHPSSSRPFAPSRRRLLQAMGLGAAALGLGQVRLSRAEGLGPRRFVLVQLRGGLDGLAALPPWADPDHRRARGPRALPDPGHGDGAVVDLDGAFGLHPALAGLLPLWQAGQLAALPAVGLAHGGRSHFDAQDLLESGGDHKGDARDGWLNRALSALPEAPGATAIGAALPLVLRGDGEVASVDPTRAPAVDPAFAEGLRALYARDPVLGPALDEALALRARVAAEVGDAPADGKGRRGRGLDPAAARAAGALIGADGGPQVAVLDVGGWDTHAGQEAALQRALRGLADGLLALREGLGPAWGQSLVLVISEFGRTVGPNGTGGTDHGTGGLALLLGGGAAGGRVHGPWPGLAPGALHEGRDLAAATDTRGLLAAGARDWLGVDEGALAERVLPGARPVDGLVRRG